MPILILIHILTTIARMRHKRIGTIKEQRAIFEQIPRTILDQRARGTGRPRLDGPTGRAPDGSHDAHTNPPVSASYKNTSRQSGSPLLASVLLVITSVDS